jgi:RimJ/RimL family protein N-acetyltransferase
MLHGRRVRLEQLGYEHLDALVVAAAGERSLYQWSPVPVTREEFRSYLDAALVWRDAGTAMPLAIIRTEDKAVIGSTRFWNIERWPWPAGHARAGRDDPDACEIGYTWLATNAIRTGINTECKLLMLSHAFERWRVLRVCFHADARNERSRRALERIGARFEGVLRAHRIAADFTARDSHRYSIIATEWHDVKERLLALIRNAP